MRGFDRFIEVHIPDSTCNLACSYCYLRQKNQSTNSKPVFQYDLDTMLNAIKKDRIGKCMFNMCAHGETMIDRVTMSFIYGVLQEGHYVNIVTNATITNSFKIIMSWPEEFRKRILFIASFHYLELKNKGLLDAYFNNLSEVKKAGCSFFPTMVLSNDYFPYIDEIKSLFIERFGFLPQITKVRNDSSGEYQLYSIEDEKEYWEKGSQFDSPLFEMERKMYKRKIVEYCHAGNWWLYLNLGTGELRGCYIQPTICNLFSDPDATINYKEVGCNCSEPYCFNGVSRIPLGVVPDVGCKEYYWELRDRKNIRGESCISQTIKDATSFRLYERHGDDGAVES